MTYQFAGPQAAFLKAEARAPRPDRPAAGIRILAQGQERLLREKISERVANRQKDCRNQGKGRRIMDMIDHFSAFLRDR